LLFGFLQGNGMRLWSLHPKYLDAKGLVSLWREALLAQAVLNGKTQGYLHHPQLIRFQHTPAPAEFIAAYLRGIHAEAAHRGYRFNAAKIGKLESPYVLVITQGQLEYEWIHLNEKLRLRAPAWSQKFNSILLPDPHPLFQVVSGPVAEWEVVHSFSEGRFAGPSESREGNGVDN
jgi:hypothetical protein